MMNASQGLNVKVERLLGEALIDQAFCQRLLADPAACARQFALSDEDVAHVTAAQATTLREFAARLHSRVYGLAPRLARPGWEASGLSAYTSLR